MPFGVAAGALGAVGAIGGALISSSASKKAAQTQADAANRAADMTQENQQQVREDLAPYRDAGSATLRTLQDRLPDLTAPFNPTVETLLNTPGYKFTLDQGLKAVQNSASARGLGVSGAAMKGAADYATGLADNTYKTQFDIDQANKTNAYNKLLGIVGAGQSSAAQTGAFGTTATQNAGNFLTSGANASAAGTVGSANALSSGINNAANSATNALLLNRLLSPQGNNSGGSGNIGTTSTFLTG